MLDQIVDAILEYKWLIVIAIVVGIAFYLIMFFNLKEFSWNKKNTLFFSLLFGFDGNDCVTLGIILTRFVYVVYFAFFNTTVGIEVLIPLVIMSMLIGILEKDYIYLPISTLYAFAIYVIIYLLSSLHYFYLYVQHDIIIFLMIISLTSFIVLYSIFSMVSAYNHLICLGENKSRHQESLKDVYKIKWPKTKLN